jgi:acid stress-induced BolA-like protein IbaG/YrbA
LHFVYHGGSILHPSSPIGRDCARATRGGDCTGSDIYGRNMDSERIEQQLRASFPHADIAVSSDDNVHFTAKVVDAGFDGLSRVARHRRVHQAIGPELGYEIHAMTLTLRTPDEERAAAG